MENYPSSHITLRGLCDILGIPPWKFGLSEYDPFNPRLLPGHGERMFDETLNVTEALIKQALAMRRIAPLPEVQKSAQSLHRLFAYFLTYLPPTSQLEPRFLSLYTQEQSIRGLMYFENNLTSLINLLKCVTEFQVPYFVFSSSCTVYGNPDVIPVTESTPPKPQQRAGSDPRV